MVNFDFKKSSRKCYESERAFQPGEEYFSALVELDVGETERRDFATEHWQGPAEDFIGWWKCVVPDLGKGKVYWAPKRILLAYFEHVLEQETTADIAFVMALLLSQKRILKLMDDGGDSTTMRLKDSNSKEVYEVSVVDVLPLRLNEIQEEFSEKLFTDQPGDYESDEDDDVAAPKTTSNDEEE